MKSIIKLSVALVIATTFSTFSFGQTVDSKQSDTKKSVETSTAVLQCGCCKQGGATQTSPIILALDIDKDGRVSAAEIKNASQSLLALDSDGDGKLSRSEMHANTGFSGVNASTKSTSTVSNVQVGATRDYFAKKMLERDANKNGQLEKDEMNEATLELLHMIDSDGDEILTFAELRNMREQIKINSKKMRENKNNKKRAEKTRSNR